MLDVPGYISEKLIQAQRRKDNIVRPVSLNSSMGYGETNPDLRLL